MSRLTLDLEGERPHALHALMHACMNRVTQRPRAHRAKVRWGPNTAAPPPRATVRSPQR